MLSQMCLPGWALFSLHVLSPITPSLCIRQACVWNEWTLHSYPPNSSLKPQLWELQDQLTLLLYALFMKRTVANWGDTTSQRSLSDGSKARVYTQGGQLSLCTIFPHF